LVGRYYDPSTGQFLSIDPLVDETGQPYAYTGDDPVNGVDPLGLIGQGNTQLAKQVEAEDAAGDVGANKPIIDIAGDVAGDLAGVAENPINFLGEAANFVIQTTPQGQVADAFSRATGLTVGGCVGGGAGAGLGASANLCYVVTPSGQSGFTVSAGIGGRSPGGGFLVGPLISNAQNVHDLTGPFAYGEGSVGPDLFSGGGQGAIGQNPCGRTIWTGEFGWAPGGPLPFSFGGGIENTRTFGDLG
jgi:hypothetical protein